MKGNNENARSSTGLLRWVAVIIGVNVLLVALGFLVPAGDDQIHIAAVQHLLRSEDSIGQSFRPTVVYVRAETELSPAARETLVAYASYANVDLRFLGDDALMALEAERSIERGGYLFSLGAPGHGIVLSSIEVETQANAGSRRSELVFYHWVGVSELWQERDP